MSRVSVACVLVGVVSGCGMLSIGVDGPRLRPRLEVGVAMPQPEVVMEAPPPAEPEPAYQQPAPMPPATGMPMVGNQQFDTSNREQVWTQFMRNPPIRFRPGFLTSRLQVDPQYAMMMGMQAASVQINAQQILANLVLFASVSPQFRITRWSTGPGPNSYTVAFIAGDQPFEFRFVYSPASGMTRVFMTVDGDTVEAWPIVFSMGLYR